MEQLVKNLSLSFNEENQIIETLKEWKINAKPSDLDDNEKRWLFAGICLNTVLVPSLRKYIVPILTELYNELTLNHKIDTQTYPTHLKQYQPTKTYLNYEAVNNSKATHGYQKAKYDYAIKSVVDISKLFVQTHMAHYTGFDETCNSSSVLGLIINIDKFPPVVRSDAEYVKLLPADNVKVTTSKDESATIRDDIEIQGHTGGKHEGTCSYF
ncbi:uncharacterized protein LOC127712898 [Mytilus californianus]|uniref:uncharacterized protein LOC127712898 n=1 Tax=Mytilus californianus TaxID=6549 RepID=UPI0022482CDD|nr:uncharacterized protein LOC127712898 [Mytilus californianus]